MNIYLPNRLFQNRQQRNLLIIIFILLFAFVTIGMDYIHTQIHNSAFYISESLLFSTYWLLFLPLLMIQWKLNPYRKLSIGLFMIPGMVLIHLLCYPALVWLLSNIFYNHTFPYEQTLGFGVTAYCIKTIIIYSCSFFIMVVHQNSFLKGYIRARQMKIPEQEGISTMIIRDGKNERKVIETKDILYFSANSPYVNIHHEKRKYLSNLTLKSLETKLDCNHFVRIHKSCIVNISKVVSYQSRQNGDFDISLTNNATLRLSRNYAADFRTKFENGHHLTVK